MAPEHCHAPDVAIGQQPSSSYYVGTLIGDCMNTLAVVLVQLDLGRHALLLAEHREADRRGLRSRLLPAQELDESLSFHAIVKSIIRA